MKFLKQDLLTLLIGLFLFPACKDTNTIGLEPDPDMAIKGALVDTLSINQTTVTDDISSTIGLERYPLGFISNDPVFGSTEAELALSVSVPSTSFTFGRGALIDSAVLVLPYAAVVDSSAITHFYGDTASSKYAFVVQQLQNNLNLQTSFKSNREWAVNEPVVGNFEAKIRPNSRTYIVDVVKGAADTSRLLSRPQLRIRLDKDFIQSHILNLDSATLSTNAKFTNSFKGLKISLDKEKMTGPGGIMFLDFSSSDPLLRSNVEIYYTNLIGDSNVERDTLSALFPIVSSVTGPVAATVRHNYTGTPVQDQLDQPKPASPYQVTYLQALAGLRNKISFPGLTSFIKNVKGNDSKSKIVVNRAELVVNIASGTDVAPYLPAERLSLYRLDIAGQRINLIDNISPVQYENKPYYSGAFGGYLDKKNKRYVFIVTGYLQQLIDGTTQDYGTFLSPSAFTEFNLNPPLTSAGRSVISTQHPGAGSSKMKLNIYYTKVD